MIWFIHNRPHGWESIIACENLKKEGINVDLINITTIKPLDRNNSWFCKKLN